MQTVTVRALSSRLLLCPAARVWCTWARCSGGSTGWGCWRPRPSRSGRWTPRERWGSTRWRSPHSSATPSAYVSWLAVRCARVCTCVLVCARVSRHCTCTFVHVCAAYVCWLAIRCARVCTCVYVCAALACGLLSDVHVYIQCACVPVRLDQHAMIMISISVFGYVGRMYAEVYM